MAEASIPIEFFCSYAHEDEAWLRKLETHLSLLQRQGLISLWHDRLVAPGMDWTKTIDTRLETASVVLLLVSADFFASDYCYGFEMKRALERLEEGSALVIPILVRPSDWQNAPFKHLQILPSNGKPITEWRRSDAALADVVGGIYSAIESLSHISTRAQSPSRSPLWWVRPSRNPFFVGREGYLRQISSLLKAEVSPSAGVPLALCGLGGIGKTQIAAEYAYRHRSDYQAVFWVEADSYETLRADFTAIATALNLMEMHTGLFLPKKSHPSGTEREIVRAQPPFATRQQEGLVKLFRVDQQSRGTQPPPDVSQEQQYLLNAVKRWFDTQADWLLILNNVEDVRIVKEFLPPSRGGHILLTTRAQSLGELAQRVVIEKMDLEEGMRFLLYRMKASHLSAQSSFISDAAQVNARAIVQELDTIPLALDQAGAYIEETGCGLAGYLVRYQQRHAQLLLRRGGENPEHPEPIATTVLLCFEKVERESPAAASILHLCAFLHPSGVQEELIAAAHFDPLLHSVATDLLELDAAIEVLRRFSLVHRISDTKMLVVHRLVQVILKDAMDKDVQRQWTERTIRLIKQVLSDDEIASWSAYFSHVQTCTELIKEQELCTLEAAQLLYQAGVYLKEQIQYEQAILFFRQAIAIQEQLLQPDHLELISMLDALAEIYSLRSQYSEALPLLQRTLSLREQALGTDHFKIASNLDNLAMISSLQGKHEEAERFFKRALMVREQTLGGEHLDLVNTLNNLALLHMEQGQYAEAEPLLQRVLVICTNVLGANHPDTKRAKENYINLLQRTGRHAEAEMLAANSETQSTPSPLWNLPYPRNPYFTGRDDLLEQLDQHLMLPEKDDPAMVRRTVPIQPLALTGFGGIGKTQIAVEYVYRSYQKGHYTHTFWVNAVGEETIIASFVEIARLLPAFPAKGETDQRKLAEAVKQWLERCEKSWLLIFDNADDILIIQEYFPQWGNGSILLTTRADAVGSLAAPIEVETLGLAEGTHLLLRRAQRFDRASDEEINEAGNIVVELDHFPLALDQAGAFIEKTGCSLKDYLDLYRTHRQALLAQRGMTATYYPHSVATTWLPSFQKVQQQSPAAAELLRLCAFLAPDSIPEELIRDGAVHWSPLLQQATTDLFVFNQMLADLLRFFLIKRFAKTHMLSLHRLVQAVLQDMMEPEDQRQWAERVVLAVNEMFPRDVQDMTTWAQCLRYLKQAQVCASLIRQHQFVFSEAADILNRTGIYLCEQGVYSLAEPLLEHALIIREQLGPEHSDTATNLNSLADLYMKQGKYVGAESLYQRALRIREQLLGPEHPDVASTLNGLGLLYIEQGKYGEAEPILQHALYIQEQQLGVEHPDVAYSLTGLANLYREQGKYTEAEPLYQRALYIRELALLSQHSETAETMQGLARLLEAQGNSEEARDVFTRALAIREQVLGVHHPKTMETRGRLIALLHSMEWHGEAAKLEAIQMES